MGLGSTALHIGKTLSINLGVSRFGASSLGQEQIQEHSRCVARDVDLKMATRGAVVQGEHDFSPSRTFVRDRVPFKLSAIQMHLDGVQIPERAHRGTVQIDGIKLVFDALDTWPAQRSRGNGRPSSRTWRGRSLPPAGVLKFEEALRTGDRSEREPDYLLSLRKMASFCPNS